MLPLCFGAPRCHFCSGRHPFAHHQLFFSSALLVFCPVHYKQPIMKRPRGRPRRSIAPDNHHLTGLSVYVLAFVALTACQAVGMIALGIVLSSNKSLQNDLRWGPMEILLHLGRGGPPSSDDDHEEEADDGDDHVDDRNKFSHQRRRHHHQQLRKQHHNHAQEKVIVSPRKNADRLLPHIVDDQFDFQNPAMPESIRQNNNNNSSQNDALARQAIQSLLHATLNETTTALDDYYRRPHIRQSSSNTPPPSSTVNDDLPVLIVGGSDGSGTRAFVDLLQSVLGVPMLVDDEGTLDVHAPAMFARNAHGGSNDARGWPPLVQLVTSQTHSAKYDIDHDLPEQVRTKALVELRRFRQSYAPRVRELLYNASHPDTTESVTQLTPPRDVSYGFKAPVTLLLLPLLVRTFGKIKFLHVVRDGRDVAFSRNRSPVTKFYHSFYGPAAEYANQRLFYKASYTVFVQAMQLWNDWNVQAMEWALQHVDGQSIDYLVVRTEDLLDAQTKYETLARMADFVGSTVTPAQLCCASRQGLVDLGQSSAAGRRTRYRDIQHVSRGNRSVVEFVEEDDPDDISMQQVALESERKALDAALQKRPDMYERIQQLRAKQMQQRQPKPGALRQDAKFLRVTKHWGKMEQENNLPHHRQRRRLQEQKADAVSSPSSSVGQRYGKWKAALQGRSDLSSLLHQQGQRGLAAFGYEPPHRFADLPANERVVDCLCEEQEEPVP